MGCCHYFSAIFYVLFGRLRSTAPVEFVEGRKAEGVGLQSSRLHAADDDTSGDEAERLLEGAVI